MDSAHSIILDLAAGAQTITDLQLYGVRLLKVKREGIGYDIVYSNTPNIRQVLHSPVTARLKFHVAGAPGGEKVFVMIKD
jgi:hypothetical protein